MPFQAKFSEDDLLSYFSQFGGDINSDNVKSAAEYLGVKVQSVTKRMNKIKRLQKVGRGRWNLTTTEILNRTYAASVAEPAVNVNYIPEQDELFVPFGNYNSIKKIIKSNKFYPTFITGLSGNGKTLSV